MPAVWLEAACNTPHSTFRALRTSVNACETLFFVKLGKDLGTHFVRDVHDGDGGTTISLIKLIGFGVEKKTMASCTSFIMNEWPRYKKKTDFANWYRRNDAQNYECFLILTQFLNLFRYTICLIPLFSIVEFPSAYALISPFEMVLLKCIILKWTLLIIWLKDYIWLEKACGTKSFNGFHEL